MAQAQLICLLLAYMAQDQPKICPIGLHSQNQLIHSVCFLGAKSADFSLTWCCLNIS
jgi:hypothetical protein